MRPTIVVAVLSVMALPAAAGAQQWTAEQQEVWEAELRCLNAIVEDVAAWKACVHPDFRGWGVEQPAPMAHSEKWVEYTAAHSPVKAFSATPLHIIVHGDLAIIQLMVWTATGVEGGPDRESWVAWTDIMRRDDGRWRWIADHGHRPGGGS